MRGELCSNPFIFAGAIIAGGGEAEEEALDFAAWQPASERGTGFRHTIAGVGREKPRPFSVGKMARVKKVLVDGEDFVRHETVSRLPDEALISGRELRAKLHSHRATG